MKLAIVGTSRLTDFERSRVIDLIHNEFLRSPKISLITGDADGVDSLVPACNFVERCELLVVKSLEKYWEPNSGHGFKERNIRIAEECDELICITTKTKDIKCYHCNMDHQRTGGCWTMKYAKSLGKPTRLYVV